MGQWDREGKEALAGCAKKQVVAVGSEGLSWPWVCQNRPSTRGKAGKMFIHQQPWFRGWEFFQGNFFPIIPCFPFVWGPSLLPKLEKGPRQKHLAACVEKLSAYTVNVSTRNIWMRHWQHLLHSSIMQTSQYQIDLESCLLIPDRTFVLLLIYGFWSWQDPSLTFYDLLTCCLSFISLWKRKLYI